MVIKCELHAHCGTTPEIEEKAAVKVAYQAIDDDEISVGVSDVVYVISKTTGDEGWWKVIL